MWIFTISYQPSGYAGHSTLLFRVHAGSWETAYPKLYQALKDRGILNIMGNPTLEDFEDAFDDDYYVWQSNVRIQCVHPEDDHYIR